MLTIANMTWNFFLERKSADFQLIKEIPNSRPPSLLISWLILKVEMVKARMKDPDSK